MNAEHAPFRHYLDLADARLGSQVVAVSDEWFAPASRMLQAGEPVEGRRVRRQRQVDGRLGNPPQALRGP